MKSRDRAGESQNGREGERGREGGRVVEGSSSCRGESSQEKRERQNKIESIEKRNGEGEWAQKTKRICAEMKKEEYPAANSLSRSRSLALTLRLLVLLVQTAQHRPDPSVFYSRSLCLYRSHSLGSQFPYLGHYHEHSPSHSVCAARGYQTSPIARG